MAPAVLFCGLMRQPGKPLNRSEKPMVCLMYFRSRENARPLE